MKEISRNYLDREGFKDTDIFTISSSLKDDEELPLEYQERLKNELKKRNINDLLISTEPKAHNMYLNFSLKNNINVLSDKPITVLKDMVNKDNIVKLKKQYYDLLKLYNPKKCKCQIMCQRLYHKGYQYIKDLLKEVVIKYNIPITYVNIYHCDGKWMMPHDLNVENHPYKYGYGKLFHSGYHFIDLLSEIVKINNNISDKSKIITSVNMNNVFFTPNDELTVFNYDDYKRMFKKEGIPNFYDNPIEDFNKYGEKNIYSTMAFRNSNGKLITLGQLNLMQHGFSRRSWINTKEDQYKGNGRIRHEQINIQVGPLMNIQVHSYQSKEIAERNGFKEETSPGGLEHFDIYVFRNTGMIGGKPFEVIKLCDLYSNVDSSFKGYNELSREEYLDDFLFGYSSLGDLRNQRLGIEILYNSCKTLYNHYNGKTTNINFKVNKKMMENIKF